MLCPSPPSLPLAFLPRRTPNSGTAAHPATTPPLSPLSHLARSLRTPHVHHTILPPTFRSACAQHTHARAHTQERCPPPCTCRPCSSSWPSCRAAREKSRKGEPPLRGRDRAPSLGLLEQGGDLDVALLLHEGGLAMLVLHLDVALLLHGGGLAMLVLRRRPPPLSSPYSRRVARAPKHVPGLALCCVPALGLGHGRLVRRVPKHPPPSGVRRTRPPPCPAGAPPSPGRAAGALNPAARRCAPSSNTMPTFAGCPPPRCRRCPRRAS